MDEIINALEKAQKPSKQLKSYETRTCDFCGKPGGLYLCESAHGRSYCKPCLMETRVIKGTRNSTMFITHPECRFCNFNPLFIWK